MFGTIRKHQSWLWIIIIAIMILGMVVWSNQSGSRNQHATGNFGSIDNKPITALEMQQAQRDVTLMYLVQHHSWPDSAGPEFNLQGQSYQRLYLMRRLQQYNIHSDPDAAAHLANLILGQFDGGQPISMDKFLQEIGTKALTAEDLEHFLETDIAIQQLETVAGLGGKLVTPEEIQSLYVEQNQEVTADAVFFSASNHLAKIPSPTPEALGQFYTNQQAAYREPDKMQVSYIFYNVTNFMPQAEQQLGTNLTREVDETLVKLGTNSVRLGKTAEEARAKVREILVQQTAGSNANVLAVSLEDEVKGKGTNFLGNLAAVAKSKGLEVKVTKPFDRQFGPAEIPLGSSFPPSSFFDLTADDPLFPQPIPAADGIYVIAFDKLIPTRIPPLSEIKSQVEGDYKFEQALKLAKVEGQSFAQTATNELAKGKSFAQTCETTRMTPVPVPPFSLSTQRLPAVEEHVDFNEFKNVAFATPVGSVSRFSETPDGGFVVHVGQRLPVDQAKMKTDLPEFSNLVRQRRQSESFSIWFTQGWVQELNNGLRDVPNLRKQ